MRKTTFIVMGAAVITGLVFVACTNDYDQFEVVATAGSSAAGQGGTAGTDGGTGGAAGKGGTAGTNNGGAAGSQGGAAGSQGGAAGSQGGAAGSQGGAAGSQGGAAGQGGSACQPDQKTCNNTCVAKDDPAYGCVDTACTACALEHASEVCQSNACAIDQCDQDWGDCAGGAADGCEQDLNVAAHCGECGRACAQDHTTALACTAGKCTPTCETGWGDCTSPQQADNGCETNLTNSNTNCGKCGHNCTDLGGGNGFLCKASVCGCDSNAMCQEAPNVTAFSCNAATGLCSCGGTECKSGEHCVKAGGSSACSCRGGAACGAGQVCCPTTGCAASCN